MFNLISFYIKDQEHIIFALYTVLRRAIDIQNIFHSSDISGIETLKCVANFLPITVTIYCLKQFHCVYLNFKLGYTLFEHALTMGHH